MSLVGNYSDSDSSGSDDDVEVKAQPCAKKPIALPSVDDLFADTTVGKKTSLAAFAGAPIRPVTTTTTPTAKRSLDAGSDASIDGTKIAKRKVRSLVPPQLRRPNVSTEDLRQRNQHSYSFCVV
ncbi:hypothetical protein AaE_014290 [Aphanomyces astaci]|uniref:Uncharacterized protein n=1 Tax=Aphanomyces astaci TaxID=112090 RepID=A0A6A4Z4B4_APHAT|nr:hypothetical protein AaE_014290 [Aphanomyces astaci]